MASKTRAESIEFRKYELNSAFPVLVLTGEIWRLSDVRSPRLHFHNCLEIGVCEEGDAFMVLGDREVSIHEGDMTFVGSEVVHTTWSAPGTRSRWSYIMVDLEQLLSDIKDLPTLKGLGIFNSMQHEYSAILPRDVHPGIYDLVRTILNEFGWKCRNFDYAVRGYFLALTVHVMNYYDHQFQTGDSLVQTHQSTTSILPALSYLRQHYAEDFAIDHLAEVCAMSPSSFRRDFTKIMGTSPLNYLIQLRIHRAVELLRATNLSILDISEEVGFHSISSFNRNFYAIMQKKPSEWRKAPGAAAARPVTVHSGWLEPEEL